MPGASATLTARTSTSCNTRTYARPWTCERLGTTVFQCGSRSFTKLEIREIPWKKNFGGVPGRISVHPAVAITAGRIILHIHVDFTVDNIILY